MFLKLIEFSKITITIDFSETGSRMQTSDRKGNDSRTEQSSQGLNYIFLTLCCAGHLKNLGVLNVCMYMLNTVYCSLTSKKRITR